MLRQNRRHCRRGKPSGVARDRDFFAVGEREEKGMVKYNLDNLPSVTENELKQADAIKDEDIDCSDIPEITNFSTFCSWEQRKSQKPAKVAIACNLDADIVEWLKKDGTNYQTQLNIILRKVMSHTPDYAAAI